ncbi:MAG TPA: tRNA (guanosine(46)-N7)-methyltransferase TrmB [Thermoanaerobaculia bacterium]|nr:tRNA (guanosine(46)-N7)-methyltransferase TrmB [Thermoanaerobaculia bacterium]
MSSPEHSSRPLGHAAVGIDPRERGTGPLDVRALFGNERPIVLEIGSGKGRFLLQEAKKHPELNFIGVEKSLHYYRHVVDRIVRHGVPNVRVVNWDAFLLLEKLVPEASVREIHIYFPDPWPRPRERKRRIIRPEAVAQLRRVLEPGGRGWYVTDHAEYFDAAVPALGAEFEIEAGRIVHDPPRTNYEAKYQAEGRPIYQVSFRRR